MQLQLPWTRLDFVLTLICREHRTVDRPGRGERERERERESSASETASALKRSLRRRERETDRDRDRQSKRGGIEHNFFENRGGSRFFAQTVCLRALC